jgi:hypothetical protein
MQILFVPKHGPTDYRIEDGAGAYPDAPAKCPHRDCGMPVKMKKHGYYRRYLITKAFKGYIRIRRYKCPVCGKTVSMLPAFCLPNFQYGVGVIWGALCDLLRGTPLNRVLRNLKADFGALTRRHLGYYRSRFRENQKLLQYGINQMSPEITVQVLSGDRHGTKEFPNEIGAVNIYAFNADFHKKTGKSFMSPQHIIA